MNQNGEWQIRNAHCHVISNFPSKAQALCAAIELAEEDGKRGHAPEVLVLHEDDRFIRERSASGRSGASSGYGHSAIGSLGGHSLIY